MTLSLTPDEAQAKIQQVDLEMDNIRMMASRILDSTQAMVGSSWQGGRAQTFNKIMAQHHEDFTAVINALQGITDKGKSDIQTLVTHDTD